MARRLSDVQRDAMELPAKERALLAEHLLATLEPEDDSNTEEEWLQEAEKRYEAYRAGKMTSKPAEQVLKEVKNLLK